MLDIIKELNDKNLESQRFLTLKSIEKGDAMIMKEKLTTKQLEKNKKKLKLQNLEEEILELQIQIIEKRGEL
jgi:hypothetical protein